MAKLLRFPVNPRMLDTIDLIELVNKKLEVELDSRIELTEMKKLLTEVLIRPEVRNSKHNKKYTKIVMDALIQVNKKLRSYDG